jgi:hypothetical protein
MATPLDDLEEGPLHWFADWPIMAVPRTGAIVYTVWDRESRFLYVGMAGRGEQAARGSGPFGRLASHASGRRSGDQFCIYVADRLVLSALHNRLTDIADGSLLLDHETRAFIQTNLGFRFVMVENGRAALELERQVQRGALKAGRPLLNPLGAR